MPVSLGDTGDIGPSRIGATSAAFMDRVAASSPVSASKVRSPTSDDKRAPLPPHDAPVRIVSAQAQPKDPVVQQPAAPRESRRLSGSDPSFPLGMIDLHAPKPRSRSGKKSGKVSSASEHKPAAVKSLGDVHAAEEELGSDEDAPPPVEEEASAMARAEGDADPEMAAALKAESDARSKLAATRLRRLMASKAAAAQIESEIAHEEGMLLDPRVLESTFSRLGMESPSRRSDDSPTYSTSHGIAPKAQQQHIAAARANDLARAAAVSTLSLAELQFGLIGEALRLKCGASAPATLSDFPPVALVEAATAFRHQLSGLAILHASAKVHTGGSHSAVHAFFGDRFDEKGAYAIRDNRFILELDPVEMAMGCYPLLQIALHLYYANHTAISPLVAPIVDAAKAVKLVKNSVFNPHKGLDAYLAVHAVTRRDKLDYDAGSVHGHLIRAINEASSVAYTYSSTDSDDEDIEPLCWKTWAKRVVKDHRTRAADSHYLYADVDALTEGLRAFADAWAREQHEMDAGAASVRDCYVGPHPSASPTTSLELPPTPVPVPSTMAPVPHLPPQVPASGPPPSSPTPTPPAPVLPANLAHDDDGPPIPILDPPPSKKKTKGKGSGRPRHIPTRTAPVPGRGGKGGRGSHGGGRGRGQPSAPHSAAVAIPAPPVVPVALPTPAAVLPSLAALCLTPSAAPTLSDPAFDLLVHAEVPCTVCATQENLLALSDMLQSGWSFRWTPLGHFLSVPGIDQFQLSSRPGSNLGYLHLVLHPGTERDPKVTVYDPSNPTHCALQRHAFLVDSGADHSILQPTVAHLLTRKGSFPGISCSGIVAGPPLPILGSGYLDFIFPGHIPRPSHHTGFSINDLVIPPELIPSTIRPCFRARDDRRLSACAPIMSAADAAARFNLFDHDALASFHLVNMGVSKFYVNKDTDYSNGILYRANGRKAPRQHAINQISMEIRQHTPRGYTWYTDISHPHPPTSMATSTAASSPR